MTLPDFYRCAVCDVQGVRLFLNVDTRSLCCLEHEGGSDDRLPAVLDDAGKVCGSPLIAPEHLAAWERLPLKLPRPALEPEAPVEPLEAPPALPQGVELPRPKVTPKRPRAPRKAKLGPPPEVLPEGARWQLLEGACLPYLQALPAGCVDHTIMDPPYSPRVHQNARGASKKGKGARALPIGFDPLDPAAILPLCEQIARLTRRWTLTFSDVESAHLWRQGLEGAGLEYVQTAFWYKIDGPPQFNGLGPSACCEAIIIAHNPASRRRWHGGGKQGFYPFPIASEKDGVERRFHETPKPLSLMLALVDDFADEGDLILDPFAGGATTGVAALLRKCLFLGCEINPDTATTARARLRSEAAGIPYSRRAEQQPLFTSEKP